MDFESLRQSERIHVVEVSDVEMEWPGLYTVYRGVSVIGIDARLSGFARLRVLFHELGHHYLHSPATCLFSPSSIQKAEYEAEIISALALLPEPFLRKALANNDIQLYPPDLMDFRLHILDLYGI